MSTNDGTMAEMGLIRDTMLVIAPKLMGGASIFALNIILIRALPPAGYGELAFCLNLLLLMDSLLGSAVDLAVLRSVTVDSSADPGEHFSAAERAAIRLKLALAATALVSMACAGEAIGWAVFHRGGGRPLLSAAITSGAALLLFRSVLVRLQLRRRFDLLGVADLCHSTLRVALVLAALVSGVRDPLVLVLCYGAAALALFGIAGNMQGAFRREVPRGLLRAIARRAGGIAQVFGVGAVVSRLDIFLLGFAANPRELGIYGAAAALVVIPELLAGYLSTVFTPRIGEQCRAGGFCSFFRRAHAVIYIGASAGAIVGVIVAEPLIRRLFPPAYEASIPIIRILLPGAFASAVLFPITVSFLMFFSPKVFLLYDLATAPVLIVLYLAAARSGGVVAVAYCATTVRLLKVLVIQGYAMRLAARVGDERTAAVHGCGL